MNPLEIVMTTKEASEKFPVADCTIRTWILDGEFEKEDVRKSGNTWLVTQPSLEKVLKRKGIIKKDFNLQGEHVEAQHLGFKGRKIEVWFIEDTMHGFFKNLPHSDMLIEFLEIYRKEYKMPFRYVLVTDDIKNSDNALYKKEKTWVLTAKDLYEILKGALDYKDIDTQPLERYYLQNA